ncbi:MAG: polysaccharide biosynthesis/export family protein [Candidatus Omnitrophica bacterium]|nr:polysaccharide biosynthesis/export family protein [Candidatus Omnitrophota bacterium]
MNWHKYFRFFLIVVFGGGYVFSSAQALAQAGVSDSMRQDMVLEYGRKLNMEDKMSVSAPQGSATPVNPYAKEGQQMEAQLQVIADNEDASYTIVAGDTLTISFKDRDQTNRAAYKVSPAGEVFFPLLGPVKVAGLNRKQARDRMDAMMKEYIRDPRLAIAINTDGRIMIFGAVGTPGIYNMVNKMSVMEALLAAGGYYKQTAEMGSVIVIRGSSEKPVLLKLNLKKMITRGDRSEDIPVKPGDFIYVPTSFISNLESFWNTANGLIVRWYTLGGSQPVVNDRFHWFGVGNHDKQ